MLNKLIERLNGHAGDAASLSEALTRLGAEQSVARTSLKEMQERRRQALLDDVSDAGLDKLEREIARAESRVEKLDLAEPLLRERLSIAQAEARQRRWLSHRETGVAAATEFISAARAAAVAHAAYVAIKLQAAREGFEHEIAAALPATPSVGAHPLCAPELLDAFQLAIGRSHASPQAPKRAEAVAPSTPPVRARLPHERVRNTDSQRGQTLAPVGDARRRPPDDTAALEVDQVRAVVLRHGYPGADGVQCVVGQRIRLPRALAQAALRSGAVEVVEVGAEAPDSAAVLSAPSAEAQARRGDER
jgi:hypothetical protein